MATRIGTRRGLVAIVAGALTASCTAANQPPRAQAARAGGQCFLASQVNGFHGVDRDTVHVTVGPRTVYELELFGTCLNVDWSQRIGIRSTGGSSWVCQGFDAELLVPSPIGVQRCAVSSVRRLTPQEVQAARGRRGR